MGSNAPAGGPFSFSYALANTLSRIHINGISNDYRQRRLRRVRIQVRAGRRESWRRYNGSTSVRSFA